MTEPHVHKAFPGGKCACGVAHPGHAVLAVPTVHQGNQAWLCRYACLRTGCRCRCGAPVVHTAQGNPTGQCETCAHGEREQRASASFRRSQPEIPTRKRMKAWDE